MLRMFAYQDAVTKRYKIEFTKEGAFRPALSPSGVVKECLIVSDNAELPDDLPVFSYDLYSERKSLKAEEFLGKDESLHARHADNMLKYLQRSDAQDIAAHRR